MKRREAERFPVDDPYAVLGVKRSASESEIRRAYRRLAKSHHPDLNPGKPAAEERFKAISAAYELLSDPEKRARYDRGEIDEAGMERAPDFADYRGFAERRTGGKYGDETGSGEPFGAEEMSELFAGLFGGEGAGRRGPIKRRGRDLHYILPVDFLDAVNGARRRLRSEEGAMFDIVIPPGSEDGVVIPVKGRGGAGLNGGSPGDALVELRVRRHPYFERAGDDLHVEVPVTLAQAVLGGRIVVPTRTGTAKMMVPEGSDTGRVLRLRGKGVPAHRGRPAGDQYVKLKVVLGTAAHDAELKEFLRRRSRADAAAMGAAR